MVDLVLMMLVAGCRFGTVFGLALCLGFGVLFAGVCLLWVRFAVCIVSYLIGFVFWCGVASVFGLNFTWLWVCLFLLAVFGFGGLFFADCV